MDNMPQSPPPFQMPNMGPAAGQAFKDIGGLQSTYGGLGPGVLPQAQATAQNLYNNPYASPVMTAANFAAPMGQAAAGAQFGTGMNLMPYASSIMNTGFDPQFQLYQRTLQQIQDQSRAANEAAGVGTTPYGAGLEDQATRNFNIDWQNAQLQRQATAAGAAGPLATTGATLAGGAAPAWLSSAMLPYSTFSGIGGNQFGALSSLLDIGGQGQGLGQQPIADYLGYLGVGNQAGGVANQNYANQLAAQKQQFGEYGLFGLGLGSALGWSPTPGGPSLGQNIYGGLGTLANYATGNFFPTM